MHQNQISAVFRVCARRKPPARQAQPEGTEVSTQNCCVWTLTHVLSFGGRPPAYLRRLLSRLLRRNGIGVKKHLVPAPQARTKHITQEWASQGPAGCDLLPRGWRPEPHIHSPEAQTGPLDVRPLRTLSSLARVIN